MKKDIYPMYKLEVIDAKSGHKIEYYEKSVEDCIDTFWSNFPYDDIIIKEYSIYYIYYMRYRDNGFIIEEDKVYKNFDDIFYQNMVDAVYERSKVKLEEREKK